MNDYHTAIVFQGGGALGAYEYGVIKALYEERRGFKPAAVTGVSIGAINAAILVGAKKNPLETLEKLWRKRFAGLLPPPARSLLGPWVTHEIERSLAAFGNPGMYELRQEYLLAPLLCTSMYSLDPLRRTLRELIDVDKLNQSDSPHVVLGAINVATGKPEYFDNRNERLEIDHIIASGSIPPAFPMTQIGKEHYWDGGLFLNTPLSSAINCLEQIPEQTSGTVRRELIVVELFPMSGPLPDDMAQVTNRRGQIMFASKFNIDHKLFMTINDTIDFIRKIEEHIPAHLHNEPAYQNIFKRHEKMDALTVIRAEFPDDKADAGDFSEDTIDYRIKAGYENAKARNIGTPHPV
jgi:NTE family protein